MKKILIIICLISITILMADSNITKQSELVSMRADLSFLQALKIFNEYTKEYDNKIIINLSDYNNDIRITINQLHWRSAIKSILEYNDLIIHTKDNAYIIEKDPSLLEKEKETNLELTEMKDEILIQVTFFEANMNTIRELGIDWSTLSNGTVKLDTKLSSSSKVSEEIFKIGVAKDVQVGSNTVDINALFKAFESLGEGNVISRPQVTVLSGEEGYVHDGVSFSIKTTDKDGNVSDKFFDSGIIVKVKPNIKFDSEGKKFIVLNVETERSSAQPDAVSTIVTISEAKTTKYLYNGEEAVVGGVTIKEEETKRSGIPILKDLPWWFFGIKYLTGYNYKKYKTKELMILMKANIISDVQKRKEGTPDIKLDIESFRKGIPSIEKKLINPKD